TISCDWLMEPSINYYIRKNSLPLLPAGRQGISDTTDFIICFQKNIPPDYKPLIADKESETILLSISDSK
ncbi:MAG: hypothetical protein ACM3N9_05075, partial [Syntrophothermus sp.]